MSDSDALSNVEVNTLVDTHGVSPEATPQKPTMKFKRKQLDDELYTPKSRHVDKKMPPRSTTRNLQASETTEASKGDLSRTDDEQERQSRESSVEAVQTVVPGNKDVQADVFDVPEERHFQGSASLGSVLSQPDFSASVMQVAPTIAATAIATELIAAEEREAVPEQETDGDPEVVYHVAQSDSLVGSPRSDASRPSSSMSPDRGSTMPYSTSRQSSPSRTPRLRDFQMPLTTPRAIVDSVLRAHQATAQKSAVPKTPRFTEADLLSFQTPAPRRHNDPQSQLRRFVNEDGEEMLLDMTPRVYSPQSIPIYTLRDLDQIKNEFERARHELEAKIQALHGELAASVSNANHHKALTAQGESLHAEYSKKHIRKVTALKTDWERKTMERLAAKDAKITEQEGTIAALEAALNQEREEKKEVIAMAEQVLALQTES